MSCVLPLLSCWTIHADHLPECLMVADRKPAFSLPGAEDLAEFADLLGSGCAPTDDTACEPRACAPFALPAAIPREAKGKVTLSCEIDFSALHGDHAVLTFDHMTGCGRVMLGNEQIASFDTASGSFRAIHEAFDLSPLPCMLAVDLTDALRLGRKETLSIHFDETHPAQISDPVMLRVCRGGFLSRLRVTPDAGAQTLTVRTQIAAIRAGRYFLRVQPVCGGVAEDARETCFDCEEEASFEADMTLAVPAGRFSAGTPYPAGAIKISLYSQKKGFSSSFLCDTVTLLCGYGAKSAPDYALPLTAAECMLAPQELTQRLCALRIPCVRLPIPAPDALYRALTRAGIAARMPDNLPLRQRLERLPCASFAAERIGEYAPVSPAASAWQMGSMTQMPRSVDASLSDSDMLHEIAGLSLNPDDASVKAVLCWLRAVAVRMRAEAARQGRYAGALCAPGEWNTPDIQESLRIAFSALHISALPLLSAWWTGSRLSVSIHAFIPAGRFTPDDPLIALTILEDEDGGEIARLRAPCRTAGGPVGVLEAQLPDRPCVLHLLTRLTLHDEVIEESSMPVYVGERGPLEAAFL